MRYRTRWNITAVLLVALLGVARVQADWPARLAASGHPGGLVTVIGSLPTEEVLPLVDTGRYVVQILLRDVEQADAARQEYARLHRYGLVTVQPWNGQNLPYTEDLVNVIIVADDTSPPAAEIKRVIRPLGGAFLRSADERTDPIVKESGLAWDSTIAETEGWRFARKPWSILMDEWTHPRHAADGNAVSHDQIVGPPRRIRWVSGPWQEVANMVTARGRNFYGGVLARDGFNGIRLWDETLKPSPSRGGFGFTGGGPVPIAGDGMLFAFHNQRVCAFEGTTGKILRTFDSAEMPGMLLYDDGVLVMALKRGLAAFDAHTAQQLWSADAELPHDVVMGDGIVGYVQGDFRRGNPTTIAVRDARSGKIVWEKGQLPWADNVTRCVYYHGILAFEVSTLNDDGPGNALHLLSTRDGEPIFEAPVLPGMNHKRQARAMFIDGKLWLLHGGKAADKKRQPVQVSSIDVETGKVGVTFPAGLAHCFPPVATAKYLFSGELDLTDLRTGVVDANRITKAACSRDYGWVPANGLIYLAPKHCVCWPMLRGYCALAPERPGGNPANEPLDSIDFPLVKGPAQPPQGPEATESDWPLYRLDAWRSSATTIAAPAKLRIEWQVDVAPHNNPGGPIAVDWKENAFVKGPVTPPVVVGERIYIARPDAHDVLAVDAGTGRVVWQFIADGRVDTPPTYFRGMCLFGSKSGSVYCLRADNGQLIWRRRAAPTSENMVAYGQVESPWPVPGSVLVSDGVAYFAAGRQSLADGGILVFAAEPASGDLLWKTRLDSVPQQGFYRSSGHEFDNFDLLFREGDGVAMSRWVFNAKTGAMSVEPWKAFSRLKNGERAAMVPQGCWSYAPRNQRRANNHHPKRPLVTFHSNQLVGLSQDRRTLYRRDFDLEGGEKFEQKWITGWENSNNSRKGGEAWRADRLMKDARWKVDLFDSKTEAGRVIEAMVRAADLIYAVTDDGWLRVFQLSDGQEISRTRVPKPLWDGLAVANAKLYLTTAEGKLVCLAADDGAER